MGIPQQHSQRRVTVEQDKIRQTSHWDVDYLPLSEVEALYDRPTDARSASPQHAPGAPQTVSNRRLGILCLAAGVGLLVLAATAARLLGG